jgi:hypothetical protein
MIRAVEPADLAYVRSTWLRSYSESDWAKLCTPPAYWEEQKHGGQAYYDGQRVLIEALLSQSVVLVAEADDGLLDGWVCGWPRTTLHYLYVRKSAKDKGVAGALCCALELVEGQPVRFSHRAPALRLLTQGNAHRTPQRWVFDPYLLTIQSAKETAMTIRRVSFIEFGDYNKPSLYSLAGSKERNDTFRETLRLRADYNDETGQITIHNQRHGKPAEEVVLHISGVRHIQLYPSGHIPQWEKDEAAALEAAKKAAAELAKKEKGAAA